MIIFRLKAGKNIAEEMYDAFKINDMKSLKNHYIGHSREGGNP